MTDFNFQRYLAAKRTVDDRALNKDVWEALADHLRPAPHILEAACGVGTMRARLAEWGIDLTGAQYLGVDSGPENIATAQEVDFGPHSRFLCADIFQFQVKAGVDLLIAAAFLDLTDLRPALTYLHDLVRPGGLAYFPLNFDGVTIITPEDARDDAVITAFHASMDDRPTGGHSRTGRRLFQALPEAGFEILAYGSSDWIVAPAPDGRYPGDEAYFLCCILRYFETSCAGVPGIAAWLTDRRRQVEAGELVYIAHQFDFLVRRK